MGSKYSRAQYGKSIYGHNYSLNLISGMFHSNEFTPHIANKVKIDSGEGIGPGAAY